MDQSNEIWKPVVGYEGIYEVSDQGRVRSLDRIVAHNSGRTQRVYGKAMSVNRNSRGYMNVGLHKNGTLKTGAVHVLVLQAFVGPRPDGQVCRHLNGNPIDNRLANLAWGTHSENQYDSILHGTHGLASKDSCIRGHWLDGLNLFVDSSGWRHCRACKREYDSSRHNGRPFDSKMADARYIDIMEGRTRRGPRELAVEDILDIRRSRAAGGSTRSIADRYGVSQSTVQRIVARRTWAHVA